MNTFTKSFKEAAGGDDPKAVFFEDLVPSDQIDNSPIELNGKGIPMIDIPEDTLSRIRARWSRSLIVKLLGHSIGYKALCSRVPKLWNLQRDFEAWELGGGFFLFKFDCTEDRHNVYSGGPYIILDH